MTAPADYYDQSYFPGMGTPAGPVKGAASTGSHFPAEPTVTASDAANAAKLAGLGYVAVPTTKWDPGYAITVGTFEFSWDGAKWVAGAAPAPAPAPPAKGRAKK